MSGSSERTPEQAAGPASAGPAGAQDHPLIAALGLAAHPEGGWYRRTWASPDEIPAHGGRRPVATSILFLLQPGEASAWHRVASAEIWLWQGGGRLTLTLGGTGADPSPGEQVTLGPDPAGGDALQAVVPAGHWQMARPVAGEAVLAGCVVAPGFDFADFELYGTHPEP
ncbi:cupin domain-containing protein [Pseudofrankia sp. DC12]|uniref:cupin domain-containing protein n=1 Tax=Pseudofrankia sp. DC12 TaxID=683315 RepID=UPI000A07054B|nr:cupin domain-containing protein [Pseudofrankia sp. DC12]